MDRPLVRLALALLAAAAALPGCEPIGVRGGPHYTCDLFNLGTGQPVFEPANDMNYWNGEPMDARTRR
jgi:hypothetical protein